MTHAPASSRGFTLVELMLALAITAMVGAAAASMLAAVSYGASEQRDLRAAAVGHATLPHRLETAIRSASAVLGVSTGVVVLWLGDTDADGVPALSEIVRIEHDTAARTITAYRSPASLAPAQDIKYTLASNFVTETAAPGLRGSSRFPAERWGIDVASASYTLDAGSALAATSLAYRLTTGEGATLVTIAGQAAPRRNLTTTVLTVVASEPPPPPAP